VAPFYAIHITSFRKENGATTDAERLSALSGVPADYIDFTVTTEGKNQGLWYRVIVGRFDDLDQARRTATTIKAKGITDFTQVYRISGR
jgi:cell division protein FtsN